MDGVAAVCAAYGLRPDEGDPAEERLDGQGIPVPLGHGTVVLSFGHAPELRTAGSIAVALEAESDLRLWLRAEPRLQRGLLAWGRIESPSLAPGGALEGPLDPSSDPEAGAVRWRLPAGLGAATFAATVQVAAMGRWQATATLEAGREVPIDLHGQRGLAILITAADQTSWQGMKLPERRPLLAVALPQELSQGASLRLRAGEADVILRNGGAGVSEDGRQIQMRYPRNAPDGALELRLEGRSNQASQRIEVSMRVPSAASAPPAPQPEAAAPLRWQAASEPLSSWLQRLTATGNPVLVEVGVDTTAVIAMPALSGQFWDGVLALCRASGLAPAISDGEGVGGGAVRLVRRPLPAMAACGPFLVVVDDVQAGRGNVSALLRCQAEPRLQPESFGAPSVAWATWAVDGEGGSHPLAQPPGTEPAREILVQRRGNAIRSEEPARRLAAAVQLVHPGVRSLELPGMLFVPRIRTWRGSAEAQVGQPIEVLLGGRAVEVVAHAAPVAIGGNPWGPGLVLRGLAGAQSLQYAVVGSDGTPIDQAGEANRMGGNGPGRPWLAWCRVPPEGRITVNLAANASLPPLSLPFRVRIQLPEGL